MPAPDRTPPPPLDAFLAAFHADVDAGAVRPLSEYLARFPGDDDAIAREYLAHKGGSAGTTSSASADRIAHYKILRQIGRGGQATVYLAEDTRLHREIALKVLDPGHGIDPSRLDRFRREAEITSKLNNPGICPVYEAGEDRGVLWIAMAYVEGEPLSTKIATAKDHAASDSTSVVDIPQSDAAAESAPSNAQGTAEPPSGPKTWTEIARVLRLFEDAARIMHVAHEHGVIHRDMKPGNIMVTGEGAPIILDFGLAQDIERDLPTLTLTGDLLGTPAYMSPEQLAAQRIRLDRRTDVYSLGVSLFECLTLRRPFEAPTRDALYQQIMTREAPDLRRMNPSVTSDLRVVVATAMEKDRNRRYQTALDLAEELRRVRMHEPIVAKPVGPLVRLQRWAQRNPALAVALGGIFAVLVAGLTVALFLLGQRDRALGEKQAALAEKSVALSDYDRLGDISRLQRSQAEADALWPCDPSKVAAMTTWVKQGAELEGRLTGHREVLDRLRASAGLLPYTDQDRAADLLAHAADQDQIGKLRKQRAKTASALAATESRASRPTASGPSPTSRPASRADSRPSADAIRAALAKLDADIARLDATVHERLTWKFASTSEQFKHDTTAKLVSDLTAFVDPDPKRGLLADVRSRLAFAESVERETIGKYETRWADAIRSIGDKAACPKYGGLRIKPQLGLIPIGKDPASGLWEFAHLQTTARGTDPIPTRGGDGRLVVTGDMGIVFVLLPGGTFRMGAMKEPPDEDTPMSAPNVDPEAGEDEGPVTELTLEPFFLSKYEMTQGQWQRLVGKNPSQYGAGSDSSGKVADFRNPVETVSSEDCDLWLGRLGLLLPTEAQWEYGARGGTTTPRWTGLGAGGLDQAANLADRFLKENGGPSSWNYEAWDDGYVAHAPAGSFAANPFGLHDVLGNVSEWCRDWYGGYDVTARPGDGLRSPSAARDRVIRGGNWFDAASLARSADRAFSTPEFRLIYLGLRPARPCLHE